MYKKSIISVCFLIMAGCVFAQQAVVFKLKYIPNQKYTTSINMKMDMTLDMQADEATMSKVKSGGMTLPMVFKMDTQMESEMITGAMNKTAATFPLTISYKDISSHQTLNNQELPQQASPLIGQQITGACDINGKLKLDSIPATDPNSKIKSMIATMLNKLFEQMKFPDKPMNIGDTFTQNVPMDIPLPGFKANFNITILYKLIAINNGTADFDIDQTAAFSFDPNQTTTKPGMKGTGSGSGAGKLKFDIAKNILTDMQTDLLLSFNMTIDKMTLSGSAKSVQTQHTSIAAN